MLKDETIVKSMEVSIYNSWMEQILKREYM